MDAIPRQAPEPNQPSVALNFEILKAVGKIQQNGQSLDPNFTEIQGMLSINSQDGFKNMFMIETFIEGVECCYSDTSTPKWKLINNTINSTVRGPPVIHALITQVDEFDTDVRQLTCTLSLQSILINLPSVLPAIPDLSELEMKENPTTMMMFTDLSIVTLNCAVSITNGPTAVLRLDSLSVLLILFNSRYLLTLSKIHQQLE